MKLYYAPGACSIGIHVILAEIGKPYEAHRVDFQKQEQYGPDFKAINPKSKVPTLVRDDGSVLTEFPAISLWLARSNPGTQLLPADLEGEVRAMEALDFTVATLHMQGFTRLFRPGNFSPNEADHDKVKARGREIIDAGLRLMDETLAGKDYLLGSFSVADAALFYVEFWAADRMSIPLPANCAAHLARMKARPSVQRVMAEEGLAKAA